MDFIDGEQMRRIVFDGPFTFNEQLQGPHLGDVAVLRVRMGSVVRVLCGGT